MEHVPAQAPGKRRPARRGGATRPRPAARRTTELRPGTDTHPPLELVRSTARRRTANAFARDGNIVVQLPAGMDTVEEERMIATLVARVTGQQRAARLGGDAELAKRARELADEYLDGVRPTSIAWSSRMQRRYGSCSIADGSIRISRNIAAYPGYVRDMVIIHELAHLLVPDHSAAFHDLLDRYPERERAEGFIEGVEHAAAQVRPSVAPVVDDADADDADDEAQSA